MIGETPRPFLEPIVLQPIGDTAVISLDEAQLFSTLLYFREQAVVARGYPSQQRFGIGEQFLKDSHRLENPTHAKLLGKIWSLEDQDLDDLVDSFPYP